MDFLKKAAADFTNKSDSAPAAEKTEASSSSSTNAAAGTTDAGAAQTQDYGDKGASPPPQSALPQKTDSLSSPAFAFASKKAGYNLDPSASEKITDGIRGAYEKTTG